MSDFKGEVTMGAESTTSWTATFAGRVILITGGTSGIGLQIAKHFLAAGACVAIVGTDLGRGQRAAENLRNANDQTESSVSFYPADVSSRTEMDGVLEAVKRQYGRLDVLVCSAGLGRKASLLDTAEDDFARLLRVNVQGAVVSVQSAAELLSATKGNVVIISSDAGMTGEREAGAYSVTKAAVNMAGKMLALDLAERGVRVNVVAPGDIVPGMKSMLRPEERERAGDDYLSWTQPPLGRYGEASEVAQTVLFLASDAASFMTGSVLLVDGGMRAGIR